MTEARKMMRAEAELLVKHSHKFTDLRMLIDMLPHVRHELENDEVDEALCILDGLEVFAQRISEQLEKLERESN